MCSLSAEATAVASASAAWAWLREQLLGVVLGEPGADAGFGVAVVLEEDRALEPVNLVDAQGEVPKSFGDLGELVREARGRDRFDRFGFAQRPLRVLEVLEVVLGVGPVRLPQGHHDRLLGGDRR